MYVIIKNNYIYSLKEINSDVVAWLKVNNTNIDYPILRAPESDQSFYLHRDYYKNYLYNKYDILIF